MIERARGTIHLDTSFLIRSLVARSEESVRLRGWLRERRPIAVSTLVWGEFLCGPLDDDALSTAARIAHRHLPVGTPEVTLAARFFNHSGRRRGSFPDCVIAATAALAGAELATSNPGDFQRFRNVGLMLAG